jgi:hypothetical protein
MSQKIASEKLKSAKVVSSCSMASTRPHHGSHDGDDNEPTLAQLMVTFDVVVTAIDEIKQVRPN